MTTSSNEGRVTSHIEGDRELILERVFQAPRALVFAAFSRPEHLRHWWGPRGWELPVCTVDFRVGGRWHYCMKCVDETQGEFYGMESWGLGLYEDIEPDKLIRYTDHFSDADGHINGSMPSTLVTLTFEDTERGGTRLTNRATYASKDALDQVLEMGMLQGVTQTWDRLDEYLADNRG
ncbi:SRPBCC domain-containing protein [Deinococcus pimensis]|uniref:SRPBCC domain-containing protein n=1 Tax=Deinococcus pimensis TaxID=309888 RepID=UPI00048A0E09|nr:SRPBCC domain-containing protein [Deinococcus pimensis]